MKNFYFMFNFYSTPSSIQQDWKNKNLELSKMFDDKSFDLSPQEFEEKCNKLLQDLTSKDINIAKLLGIDKDEIHNLIGENFIANGKYGGFLDRLHLLNINRESGITTTGIIFPDPLNPIYANDTLSGMPYSYKAEIAQQELTPLTKLFDKVFSGQIRYFFSFMLGLDKPLSTATGDDLKIIQENAPTSFIPEQKDKALFFKENSSKDRSYFSIPPAERLRISSLIANSFDIKLKDGSKLLQEHCPFSNIESYNKSINEASCMLLRKSFAKIYWTDKIKYSHADYYQSDESIHLLKLSKEGSLPSEFNLDRTIIHEFGHHFLYNVNHPNVNFSNQNYQYPSKNNDYFFGSASSRIEDALKVTLFGYSSADYACHKSIQIGPVDFVTKKFAEYCSYRFQNNSAIGRAYKKHFEKIDLKKINTETCSPLAKSDPYNKILSDAVCNFAHIAFIISVVDFYLSFKNQNSNLHENRENIINFITTLSSPLVHGFDSIYITGAKISTSHILKTNLIKNFTNLICEKVGYEDSSIKKSFEAINKSYEKLPKITQNALKTFATYHALFFLKDLVGGRPITTGSGSSLIYTNLYYSRNIDIAGLVASSLISSLAIGIYNVTSKKLSNIHFNSMDSLPSTSFSPESTSPLSTSQIANQNSNSREGSPFFLESIIVDQNNAPSPYPHNAISNQLTALPKEEISTYI